MSRITINLNDETKRALIILAEKEFRDPHGQAALILREGLESRGLLDPVKTNRKVSDMKRPRRGYQSVKAVTS